MARWLLAHVCRGPIELGGQRCIFLMASEFGGELFVTAKLAGDLVLAGLPGFRESVWFNLGLLVGAPDAFGVACWSVIENEASVGVFGGVRWLAPGRML